MFDVNSADKTVFMSWPFCPWKLLRLRKRDFCTDFVKRYSLKFSLMWYFRLIRRVDLSTMSSHNPVHGFSVLSLGVSNSPSRKRSLLLLKYYWVMGFCIIFVEESFLWTEMNENISLNAHTCFQRSDQIPGNFKCYFWIIRISKRTGNIALT